MKKLIRRLFIFTGVLLFALISGAVILAAFFEKEIGERVITEVNKQLVSDIKVDDVSLSLLTGFPAASANLEGVVVPDDKGKTLIEAGNIAFRFKLLSLFTSNIQVHSVVIQNGSIVIDVDRKGKVNANILKKKPKKDEAAISTSREVGLSINSAELEDVEVIYKDARSKQKLFFEVKEATLSGEFASDRFSLISKAAMRSRYFELDGKKFLAGKKVNYDADIDVDLKKKYYEMREVVLGIEGNTFEVDGSISQGKGFTDFDLTLKNKKGSLAGLLSWLPREYRNYFSDFKTKGTFYFDGEVDGKLSSKQLPTLNAVFGLKSGKISSNKLTKSLEDVTFEASLSNGKDHTWKSMVFEIKDFKGYFNRELIESKLKISNFSTPYIDFKLDGVLPLRSIYPLFNVEHITNGSGELEIKDLAVKGRWRDMINPQRIKRVKASGSFIFDDASLLVKGENLLVDKGELKVMNNAMSVNNMKIEGFGSALFFDGTFKNVLPVLLSDSLNTNRAELDFKANLRADELDFDRLVAITNVADEDKVSAEAEKQTIKVANNINRERITQFLSGTINARIGKYNYRKVNGSDFKGTFTFYNNELVVKGSTNAMGGKVNLNGKGFFTRKPYVRAKVDCRKIDFRELFRQFEDFGQKVLSYKNVKGTVNGKIAVDAFWDEAGSFLDEDLRVLGDISIDDGELVNFQMLYDFSTYVKIQDLRHIKFVNMRNWLEVKDGKVIIPSMFIQSNALNITVSGEHSFANAINYNMKINAGQVLLNKFKKHDPRLRPQEAKRQGWFNLYYRIYGTVDDYKVKNDRKTVKRNIERSDRKKLAIRREIKAIFGSELEELDEPIDWKDDSEPVVSTKPTVQPVNNPVPAKDTLEKDDLIFLPDKEEEVEYVWPDDDMK